MSRKNSIFNHPLYKPTRENVTLVGAGSQGRRLAYMWSSRGNDVHLIDTNQEQLEEAVCYINDLRVALPKSDVRPGVVMMHGPEELPEALQQSWLVVECVPENLLLKRKIIYELDHDAPVDTIIASNSSSFTISEIIDGLDLMNDAQILSAHSYWPPETTTLEIMGHKYTEQSCIRKLMARSREHGFSPFHVRKESMGYIHNRIWAAIKREALLVAAEGVAAPHEIDAVFKDVLKARKGPFELMDNVGLDVVLDVEEHYAAVRPHIDTKPREYLKTQIKKGRLGVKNGQGFYRYRKHASIEHDESTTDRATNGTNTSTTTNGEVNKSSEGTVNGNAHPSTNGSTHSPTNGTFLITVNGATKQIIPATDEMTNGTTNVTVNRSTDDTIHSPTSCTFDNTVLNIVNHAISTDNTLHCRTNSAVNGMASIPESTVSHTNSKANNDINGATNTTANAAILNAVSDPSSSHDAAHTTVNGTTDTETDITTDNHINGHTNDTTHSAINGVTNGAAGIINEHNIIGDDTDITQPLRRMSVVYTIYGLSNDTPNADSMTDHISADSPFSNVFRSDWTFPQRATPA